MTARHFRDRMAHPSSPHPPARRIRVRLIGELDFHTSAQLEIWKALERNTAAHKRPYFHELHSYSRGRRIFAEILLWLQWRWPRARNCAFGRCVFRSNAFRIFLIRHFIRRPISIEAEHASESGARGASGFASSAGHPGAPHASESSARGAGGPPPPMAS